MEIVKAESKDSKQIHDVVKTTIISDYSKCYPKELIDFFFKIHSEERIADDIENGNTWLIQEDGKVVGTGSLQGNHIGRVYILPSYQNRGFGSQMMDILEYQASKEYDEVILDPSDRAIKFYKRRGYETVKGSQNGRRIMTKKFK